LRPKRSEGGPARELSEREGNEQAAQRQAEFLGRNAQAVANPRESRKDDVGGKRAKRSQPREQEQAPSEPALGRRGVRDRKHGH